MRSAITCTRRIQFCAGHRLKGHGGKCAHLHGHNYVALFTASGPLEEIGVVIDFSELKARLGKWIEDNWDHGFIFNKDDGDVAEALLTLDASLSLGQKMYSLDCNPTAENLARYLGEVVAPQVMRGTGILVVHVRVWETENCYADWSRA